MPICLDFVKYTNEIIVCILGFLNKINNNSLSTSTSKYDTVKNGNLKNQCDCWLFGCRCRIFSNLEY